MTKCSRFTVRRIPSTTCPRPKGSIHYSPGRRPGFCTRFKHGLKGRFNYGNFSDSTLQALRTSERTRACDPGYNDGDPSGLKPDEIRLSPRWMTKCSRFHVRRIFSIACWVGPKGRYIIAQVEGLGFVCASGHGLKGRANCGNFSESTLQALRTSETPSGLRPGL